MKINIKNIAMLIMTMLFLVGCGGKTDKTSVDATPTVSTHTINEEKTLSLIAVGDNLIHDTIYNQASVRAGGNGYDFGYAYEGIAGMIDDADIAVINQETLLASAIYPPSSYPRFNSPQEVGEHMVDIGFDVFSMANNHSYDMGSEGIQATLDFWDTQNAVVCGAYRNQNEKNEIKSLKRNGVNVAFIACSESTNGLSLPSGATQGINLTSERDFLKEQIMRANDEFDLVVVCVHWGDEGSGSANDFQKSLAKDMVDWGADFIIGNHPHVLQEYEYITREDKTKGLVIYSLGNFISAQNAPNNLCSVIMKVDFTISKDKSPDIADISFVPIVTHYENWFKNLRIIPFSEYSKELADIHGIRKDHPEFSYDYLENVFRNYR